MGVGGSGDWGWEGVVGGGREWLGGGGWEGVVGGGGSGWGWEGVCGREWVVGGSGGVVPCVAGPAGGSSHTAAGSRPVSDVSVRCMW